MIKKSKVNPFGKLRTGSQKSKLGFTLIELLIVMAIIGLLAFGGWAVYRNSIIRSRDATRKNDLKQIQTALNLYQSIWGVLPEHSTTPGASGQIVGCRTTPPSICSWGDLWQREGIIYMKPLPKDPLFPQRKYTYVKRGEGAFALMAILENSEDKDAEKSQERCYGGPGRGNEYVVCQE